MNQEDAFRILVLTDNHMGYKNNDPNLKEVSDIQSDLIMQDSFEAVEEILRTAKRENVDFVIQGGDLYHDANPSLEVLNRGMEVFTKTIFGTKKHNFEMDVMDDTCSSINIENEDVNIAVPVFAIHGNHDYPTNSDWRSVLEILKTNNLINYFGKREDLSFFRLRPICFKKKTSSGKMIGIALYGMGYMQHSKLRKILKEGKYEIVPPADAGEVEYKSIMVMHQNRFKGRGSGASKNLCIEFQLLPREIDLFIWGHEHDCYTHFEPINGGESYVYQPGSSVATSLTEGEARSKHYGIVSWSGAGNIQLERAIEIKAQRHLEFKTFSFENIKRECEEKVKMSHGDLEDRKLEFEVKQHFHNFVVEEIRKMLSNALATRINHNKLPFVRLRIVKCPRKVKDLLIEPKLIDGEFNEQTSNK